VQSVTVDSTWFSDHALLYVTLSPLGPMEHVPIWRRPHALPWEQVQEHFANMPALEEQPNQPEFYRALWQHLEAGLDGHLQQAGLPGLTPQQRGRACTTEVTWVRREIPPLKRSRKSDIQIQFAGDHWQHFHWTRQLRRIQSYCHLVKPRQDGTRPMQEIQKLWRSILTAPGFPKGFRKYWPTRAVQAAGTLPEIPRPPLTMRPAPASWQDFLLISQPWRKPSSNTDGSKPEKPTRRPTPNLQRHRTTEGHACSNIIDKPLHHS
jgi:hypothetical protein